MAAQTHYSVGSSANGNTSPLVTSETPFGHALGKDQFLFRVSKDYPASTVLNLASCLLVASIDTINNAMDSLGEPEEHWNILFGAKFLQETANALINATTQGITCVEASHE